MDQEKLSLATVEALLRKTTRMTFENQDRLEHSVGVYKKWCKDNDEKVPPDVFEALECGLDGAYWQ